MILGLVIFKRTEISFGVKLSAIVATGFPALIAAKYIATASSVIGISIAIVSPIFKPKLRKLLAMLLTKFSRFF